MRARYLGVLVLLGAVWGASFLFIKIGVQELAPETLVMLRLVIAAACYAISGIYARRAFRGMPALVPATGQMLAGALLITPYALLVRGIPAPLPSATAIGAVVALAVFGTAIAYILLYWLIDRMGATRSSMVTYLLPPFALVYGALFLGEAIALNALLGLVLVLVLFFLMQVIFCPSEAKMTRIRS
jgi:drug/metabolite transporter (DMT)-like permease